MNLSSSAAGGDHNGDWLPSRAAPLMTPRSPRTIALLLIARITSDRYDALCCVRNLSSGGLKADVRARFVVGERIRIEFRNGDVIAGEVRWTDRRSIGVQFDAAIDVERLLSQSSTSWRRPGGQVPRAPRLPTSCPAELKTNGRIHRVSVVDLSQGGAKLAVTAPVEKDELVTLVVPGLPPQKGVVRWAQGGKVGVAFLESIAFATLAEWLVDPATRYSAADS